MSQSSSHPGPEPSDEGRPGTPGPDTPASGGFARTFAKGARVPRRGMVPGRRVWTTVLGTPVLAGAAAGAVALVALGASNLHFGGGDERPVAAAQPKAPVGNAPAAAGRPQDKPDGGHRSPTPGNGGAGTPNGPAGKGPVAPGGPNGTGGPADGTPGGDGAGTGANGGRPKDGDKPGGAPRKAVGTSLTYTGYAGPGCPTPAGGGYSEQGAYNDGAKGWYGLTGGSTTDGGCSGQFTSVPMSGSKDTDGKNRVMWWWQVGDASKTCDIAVYVPHGPNDRDVNGAPTKYHVLADAFNRDTMYASFTINQAAHRGSWQSAGTFPVKAGKIGVKLLDRGVDWGSGRELAHHAAGALRVTCHG
ncbi:hypothetical protein ACFU7T_31455 [Streptomyces sp. NPDC057555]|uniref:hypothetical protein n=1 Tax=Streptomyces sp. NPDC057555 TaxID=3346166 RepID=UPI003686A591